MGAYCGYLALNAAIGAGAETAYLPEEGVTLDRLKEDSVELIHRYWQSRVVLFMFYHLIVHFYWKICSKE